MLLSFSCEYCAYMSSSVISFDQLTAYNAYHMVDGYPVDGGQQQHEAVVDDGVDADAKSERLAARVEQQRIEQEYEDDDVTEESADVADHDELIGRLHLTTQRMMTTSV